MDLKNYFNFKYEMTRKKIKNIEKNKNITFAKFKEISQEEFSKIKLLLES